MKKLATTIALLLPILASSVACGPSLYRTKPRDPAVNQAVTSLWAAEIKANAKTGDWILTRSYSAIGDAIALGSFGEEISHAAIYDAERNTIIEAVGEGVREVPLDNLLDRNRVAIVVRPHGTTVASRRAALERARGAVGSEFDYAGLFGAQTDKKFYCSELVVWAAGLESGELVITPSSLIKRGEVVYLSGNREDMVVQSVALSRSVPAIEPATRTAALTAAR